jgi:hypothetical protein
VCITLLDEFGKLLDRKNLETGNVNPHNLSVAVQECLDSFAQQLRDEMVNLTSSITPTRPRPPRPPTLPARARGRLWCSHC